MHSPSQLRVTPLEWPDQIERIRPCRRSSSSGFRIASVDQAVTALGVELGRRPGVAVLCAPVRVEDDGSWHGDGSGEVAVVVKTRTMAGAPLAIAVDGYDSVRGNLAAARLDLVARRTLERHRSSPFAWQDSPSPELARLAIGVEAGATDHEIRLAWLRRRQAIRELPAWTASQLAELARARDVLLSELKGEAA